MEGSGQKSRPDESSSTPWHMTGRGTCMKTKLRVIAGAALCGIVGLVVTVGGTVAAAAPTSGSIKVWVKPTPTGTTSAKHPGKVLIIGVIGDYGTAVSENAAGKTAKKGAFKLLRLHKGTILVNDTALNKAIREGRRALNYSNCSIYTSGTATIPVVKGTGAYAGITGTLTFTASFGSILPKKSGACTLKKSTKPLVTSTSFSGTGTVSIP
jgi:hypothetical protein